MHLLTRLFPLILRSAFISLLVIFCFILQGILKQNKFTSEFLIKLVAINLFLLWNIRTGGADDLEEFDCIGRDEEVKDKFKYTRS